MRLHIIKFLSLVLFILIAGFIRPGDVEAKVSIQGAPLVYGYVKDVNNVGVPNVWVKETESPPSSGSRWAKTDQNGYYEFGVPEDGFGCIEQPLTFTVVTGNNSFTADPNYTVGRIDSVDQGAGSQEVTIPIQYLPLVTLSGRVTNSSGAALASVVINQNISNPPGCNVGSATTNSSGYFSIANVRTGTGFCLRPPTVTGYSSSAPGSYECQVAGGQFNSCGPAGNDLTADNAYNFVYSPTVTAPAISKLTITGTNTSGLARASGNQASQNGASQYNPMTLTLEVTGGQGGYNSYVAFYDQSSPGGKLTNQSTFLADIQTRLNGHPERGFLLKYDSSTGKNWVWNPNTKDWIDLSLFGSSGYPICDNNVCTPTTTEYRVTSTGANSWRALLDKHFGSKTAYTAVYATNSGGTSFNQDIDPTTP